MLLRMLVSLVYHYENEVKAFMRIKWNLSIFDENICLNCIKDNDLLLQSPLNKPLFNKNNHYAYLILDINGGDCGINYDAWLLYN